MADQYHQPNVVQYRPQQPHRGDNESQYLNQQISGPPNSTVKVVAVATLVPVGGILLGLSGLSLVATLIGLAIATPLFLLFSPVLVPAALVLSGSVAGFLASGAFGITGLSSFSWIVNYLRQAGGQGARHSPTPTWQLQQVVNQRKREDEQQVDQAKREQQQVQQVEQGKREQEQQQRQQVDQAKREKQQQPQQDTKDHSKSQEAAAKTTTPTPTPEAGKAKTHDATKK